jgi:cell division protein FtsA
MAGDNYIASIDIGTDKIALLAAEKDYDNRLRIIGHKICPSDGVKKGVIFSIDSLSRVITKLIEETNKSFNLTPGLFRVNISDTHLTCTDGKGKVSVNEVVTRNDVDAVLASAMAMSTPSNKEKIHRIKKKFTINESVVVDNPLEMEAEVLESKVHIVTVSSANVRNIENCLKQSDLQVEKNGIVLTSIAKSHAILTQEEKDNGVCIVDIGAGVTSFSVFNEEGIVQSGVISMGGDEVTRDIAYAFDTSLEEAKRLKEKYGVAKSSTLKEDKLIDFTQPEKNKEEHQLSSLQLSEVIEEAYREILLALKNELKHHNLDKIIKSGFVLCGGGTQVISCEELVRDFFTRRAKMGTVHRSRISGLDNILTDFRYAGSIGLLLHEDDLRRDVDVISNGNKGVMGKLKEWTAGGF